MSRAVLDSSALLALLLQETGGDTVSGHVPGSLLSAVNLSETIGKLVERGMSLEESHRLMAEFPCEVVPFDGELAYLTASLRIATKPHGLSLGDRACLALGLKTGCPVVTADRQWQKCKVGVQVIQIR